ncbi:MAG: hypothetical protein RLZZ611_685 [Cyanobacteriota bacterium]|jgi:hypothetical protein
MLSDAINKGFRSQSGHVETHLLFGLLMLAARFFWGPGDPRKIDGTAVCIEHLADPPFVSPHRQWE